MFIYFDSSYKGGNINNYAIYRMKTAEFAMKGIWNLSWCKTHLNFNFTQGNDDETEKYTSL